MLYINDIIKESMVNGPGKRSVIWFQGCSIHCKGCANRHMWTFGEGSQMKPQELFDIMGGVNKISISGGEPLDQYEDLLEFLRICRRSNVEVLLTTGYKMEQIKESFSEILEYIDILIDGPFRDDKLDSTPAWRGSTNQGITFLTSRAKKYETYKPKFTTEMVFKEDGSATITGFTVPMYIKGT